MSLGILEARIDHQRRDALALYLQYCTVPAPYSIYQDIFKLEPGYVLSLDVSGLAGRSVKAEPYWRFADAVRAGLATPIQSETEAVERRVISHQMQPISASASR